MDELNEILEELKISFRNEIENNPFSKHYFDETLLNDLYEILDDEDEVHNYLDYISDTVYNEINLWNVKDKIKFFR